EPDVVELRRLILVDDKHVGPGGLERAHLLLGPPDDEAALARQVEAGDVVLELRHRRSARARPRDRGGRRARARPRRASRGTRPDRSTAPSPARASCPRATTVPRSPPTPSRTTRARPEAGGTS